MWNVIEDDDVLLAKALEESLRHYQEVELPRTQLARNEVAVHDARRSGGENHEVLAPIEKTSCPLQSVADNGTADGEKQMLYEGIEAEGFDLEAGKTWTYPTNYPTREYQKNIVTTALFNNTLVSLPTGLGKTFIAAVVMYNFYKWYPKGKVIFMAPTKPLVAQQVEQCYKTMGIPHKDTAEMTGSLSPKERLVIWKTKRLFFLTPQVVQNDLSSGICPATAVKCVVIDEAHRATGEYAYTQVIKLLKSFDAKFRVLALSATPGSDITAVQTVVSSLMISHIEIRNEDSPDLAPYTHERKIEIMSVSVGPTILQIRDKYLTIMGEYCRKLQMNKVLFGNVSSLTRFQILRAWDDFRKDPPRNMSADTVRLLQSDFAVLHALAHGADLLQNYGLRLLVNNLTGIMEDPANQSGVRLKRNVELLELMEEIQTILNPPPDPTDSSQPEFIYGHPKLDALKDVIERHFKDFEQRGVETRVIVFCEYREAVIEIRQLLSVLEPLVKPVSFMGQSIGKHGKGITQKQQLLVMENFRKGVYNTLVSTSVGEEGLDIGEVDLIICYDAKNSPIRQVQRMGRTGRKRKGRIVVLVTEGKEEMKFRAALKQKKNINAMLVERDSLKGFLLESSPSLMPEGVEPQCEMKLITIAPSKTPLHQQDLRKMFKKTSNPNSASKEKPVPESPYIAEEEIKQMLPSGHRDISKAEDIWQNLDLSKYLEWQRYLQWTYEVEHSTSTETMKDLLTWSEAHRGGNPGSSSPVFKSQYSATQIWPGLEKRKLKRTFSRKRGQNRNTATKPQRPASPCPSDSSDDGPLPSYFQPRKPAVAAASGPSTDLRTDTIREHRSDNVNVITLDDSSLGSVGSAPSPPVDDHVEDLDLKPAISKALDKLATAFGKKEESIQGSEISCVVCDRLAPCEKIMNLVNHGAKPTKENFSWKDVKTSLKEILAFIPRLSADSFSALSPPGSPFPLSMLPREEFQRIDNDNFYEGIICGGVGDVSPIASPFSMRPKDSKIVEYHSDNSLMSIDHGNPDRKQLPSTEKHDPSVDDVGFSFLGLRDIDELLDECSEDKKKSCDDRSPIFERNSRSNSQRVDKALATSSPRTVVSPEASPVLGSQMSRKIRGSHRDNAVSSPRMGTSRKSLTSVFEADETVHNANEPLRGKSDRTTSTQDKHSNSNHRIGQVLNLETNELERPSIQVFDDTLFDTTSSDKSDNTEPLASQRRSPGEKSANVRRTATQNKPNAIVRGLSPILRVSSPESELNLSQERNNVEKEEENVPVLDLSNDMFEGLSYENRSGCEDNDEPAKEDLDCGFIKGSYQLSLDEPRNAPNQKELTTDNIQPTSSAENVTHTVTGMTVPLSEWLDKSRGIDMMNEGGLFQPRRASKLSLRNRACASSTSRPAVIKNHVSTNNALNSGKDNVAAALTAGKGSNPFHKECQTTSKRQTSPDPFFRSKSRASIQDSSNMHTLSSASPPKRIAENSAVKCQGSSAAAKTNITTIDLSSDEDENLTLLLREFEAVKEKSSPKFVISPIAKPHTFCRSHTPESSMSKLRRSTQYVAPENPPDISVTASRPCSPEISTGNAVKRVRSPSPCSPVVPLKKANLQILSSPESPLFARKKAARKPLNETCVESDPQEIVWLEAKKGPEPKSGRGSLASVPGPSGRFRRLSGGSSSDDELGEFRSVRKKPRKEVAKKNANVEDTGKKLLKRKEISGKKKRCAFVESEAVESEDGERNSSDGESTSLDELDSSFIDDSPDKTVVESNVDMKACYLRSVRSPAVKSKGFKIPDRHSIPFQGDVYSQPQNFEESCYMNDSFCVDEVDEGETQADMSLLEVAEARLKAARKELRLKKKKASRLDKEEKPGNPKKRSRILAPIESDSEGEQTTYDVALAKTPACSENLDEWFDDDFDVPEFVDLVETDRQHLSNNDKTVPAATKPCFGNQASTSKAEFKLPLPRAPQLQVTNHRVPSTEVKASAPMTSSKSPRRQCPTVQPTSHNDLKLLLDDDFDLSVLDALEQTKAPPEDVGDAAKPRTASVKEEPLVVIVSSRQVASATSILRTMRVTYKLSIVCRSITSADYVISRRLGVSRVPISLLRTTEKIEPQVRRLKESFNRTIMIVENDKEKRPMLSRGPKSKAAASTADVGQPEWTVGACTTLAALRRSSVELLFSDSKDHTAELLSTLTISEREAGYSIPQLPEQFSNETESKLKFLLTLPGMNIALAIHLIYKFSSIGSFVSQCRSVKDVQKHVGVGREIAQKIYHILCQVQVS